MADTILRDLREPLSHADRFRDITQSLHENRMTTSEGAKASRSWSIKSFQCCGRGKNIAQ